MCAISVPCPLCSQTSFTSVTSLRMSLIKAINSPLSCPICPEILMGLDKLTLHLITHNNLINCDDNKCTATTNIRDDDQKKIEENLNCELLAASSTTTMNVFCNAVDIFKYTNTPLEISTTQAATELIKSKTLNKAKSTGDIVNYDLHKTKMENLLIKNHIKLDNTTKIENNIEPKCDICGIIFGNYDVLEMHTKVMHQIDDFNNCIVSLTSNPIGQNMNIDSNSLTMLNINNNNSLKMFQCHLCSKSYKMKARLRLHLKVKHLLGLSSSGTDKSTPKLNICERIRMINMKQQTLNLDLNNSQKTIINNTSPSTTTITNNFILQKPVVVEQIQNTTQSTRFGENGSEDIILIENGQNDCSLSPRSSSETSKTWKCDYCSKFYTTKYFLKKHKRIHTGETPYTCEICKKSFTFQQSYHKHLLYHSDEKPHICGTCGRAFKELSTLHNHERIHSGEKPFECETCGKRFRQRVSNYVHQRTHTGVKPYTCQLCNKTFRYKVTLRTHKCSGEINNHLATSSVSPLSPENLSAISERLEEMVTEKDKKLFIESKEESVVDSAPIQNSDLSEDSLQKLFQNTSILVEPQSSTSCSNNCKDLQENDNIITNDMNEEMLSKTIDEIVAESCRNLFKDQSCETSYFTS